MSKEAKLTREEKENTTEQVVYSKKVTLPSGLQVHFVEIGPADAPVIILTHGFLGSWRDWRYNLLPLANLSTAPRRVIALDWAGFGNSGKPASGYSLFFYAEYLKQFADALKIKEFDLIGHSMGGKHNLAFAVLYPQYVRSLVLVASDGLTQNPWWAKHTEARWFDTFIGHSAKMFGNPALIKANLRRVFHNPRFYLSEAEIEKTARALREPAQQEALKALSRSYPALSLKTTGLAAKLSEIRCPVLIVWGAQDQALPLKNAYELAKLIPQTRVHVFDKSGHMPQIERASDFNHLVLDFLKNTTSTRSTNVNSPAAA
jgi:pimeloyl-ACP methyl ester carboxylesterase